MRGCPMSATSSAEMILKPTVTVPYPPLKCSASSPPSGPPAAALSIHTTTPPTTRIHHLAHPTTLPLLHPTLPYRLSSVSFSLYYSSWSCSPPFPIPAPSPSLSSHLVSKLDISFVATPATYAVSVSPGHHHHHWAPFLGIFQPAHCISYLPSSFSAFYASAVPSSAPRPAILSDTRILFEAQHHQPSSGFFNSTHLHPAFSLKRTCIF